MNERYKAMLIVRNAAILKLPPVALTIISPPSHGKTETKKIFLSNCDDCYELTSMSDSALGDELLERVDACVLILDDPLNWDRNDYVNAVRYFKNLHGGLIATPRKTKFKRDNISVPARIQTITLMHSKQWNEAQKAYALTGFEERSLICWSTHSKEMKREISDYYLQRDHNEPVPVYDLTDFELLSQPRQLTKDERDWIEKAESSRSTQSLISIARSISENTLESMRAYLTSNSKRKMYLEDIKFL